LYDFAPSDQQNNVLYSQYGVFWLYNWFQAENNNMNIFFLMNGNIFNYSLASEQYMLGKKCWWSWSSLSWKCSPYYAYAIPPAPPANTSTITGEPIFVQSYINAYNTAFNQPANRQNALYKYSPFYPNFQYINNNFVSGTFGYFEAYISNIGNQQSTLIINKLKDKLDVYTGTPYLFVSAGSGAGSGFMYLDWIIVTYGVPYIVNIS
jgi:hypothetical protein